MGLPECRAPFECRHTVAHLISRATKVCSHVKASIGKGQKHVRGRRGVGGNPKYAWLNEQRVLLKGKGLSRQQFNESIRQMAAAFDSDPALQQAARDKWRLGRALGSLAASGADAADRPRRCGPWGLGDGFWPLGEEALERFMAGAQGACGRLPCSIASGRVPRSYLRRRLPRQPQKCSRH